jgi:ATP/maltotriose-dependent transcriptional regulator MalT/DNA-binding SARP family transcriptional activator
MVPTPNASKYLPPILPKVVRRKRLIKRFCDHPARRLILICGQAAQGKSTLVADYLSTEPAPAAWLHLDEGDSDHANFYGLLVCALQQALPGLDLSAFLKTPPIILGGRQEVGRHTQRLGYLLGRISGLRHIVLDGLERLNPQGTAMMLIDYLIGHLPDGARLFLISREMPPLSLQEFKIKQQAMIMTNDELAFSEDEIGSFFQLNQPVELSQEQLKQVMRVTGGWVGGLVLLAEYVNRLPSANRSELFSEGLPAILRGEAQKYFAEAIFSTLSAATRTFLIHSSVLEVLEPQILKGLSGLEEADAILKRLVERNLFIQAVFDGQKGLVYRYNHLFQTFLSAIFRSSLPSAEQSCLLQKAGDLYWEAERIEEAIGFYLRAESYGRAAAGICKIAMDLIVRGRFSDLAQWIQRLPKDMIASDTWLWFYLCLTRRISGGQQNIADFQKAFEMFKASDDTKGQVLALAYLIEAAVFLGLAPSAILDWIGEAERLLADLSQTPYYAYAKGVLWQQIGLGHIAGTGDLQKGISACQNAYLLAQRIDETSLKINATIISILGHATAGEFLQADQALDRIGRFSGSSAYPEYRALQNIVRLELAINRGDLKQAGICQDIARKEIETFGLLFLYPAFIHASALLEVYRGNYPEAEKISQHLADVAVLANSAFYRGQSHRLTAMIYYFQGRLQQAKVFAGKALNAFDQNALINIHLFRIKHLLGLILWRLNQDAEAERRLLDALDFFSNVSSQLSMAEAHLSLALLYDGRKDATRARCHLAAGFEIIARRRYVHFLIMAPADVTRACLLSVNLDLEPGKAQAQLLLSTHLAENGKIELEKMVHEPGFKKRQSALAVRRSIYRSKLPVLEIQTLGGFRVIRSGQGTLNEAHWRGNRPKLLLKSIIVHGAREIPKDLLIDDLWPDSSPAAAEKSFKVTLHRLRKILEPQLNPSYGSAYLHLKDNLVALDPELCTIDVEEFLYLYKKIVKIENRAEPDALLALCAQAKGKYQGDFLPEEPYLPWAEMKRAVLRENYLTLLSKMIDGYAGLQKFEQAAHVCKLILQYDPASESAIQRLMHLYLAQGLRNAALKAYEDFTAHLKADIDAIPDPATTAIYKTILAHGAPNPAL